MRTRRSPACRRSTRAPTPSSPACPTPPSSPRRRRARRRRSPRRRPATAAVWHDGLHPIPDGLAARRAGRRAPRSSRSRLLSWRGKLRAAARAAAAAPRPHGDSIGALVRGRFGDEVHERLVDAAGRQHLRRRHRPLQPGDGPQLAALAGASAQPAARRPRAPRPRRRRRPGRCSSPRAAGMGALVDAVADARPRPAARPSSTGRAGARVAADGARWRVDGEPVDAVVLATPAAPTAPLRRRGARPTLAGLLGAMDHAGVVIVTLAVAATGPSGCAGAAATSCPSRCSDS